ncbi:MAG: hypothetical protein JWM86_309, partial [Thermoleophilia bacterium]|nr:hypothetical protein [Thermoleophilia bacterium]
MPSELASIVLGDAVARRDSAHAPERTPLPGGEYRSGGYDARSVLVLAIVVASLAAVLGWGMTLGRDDRVEPASTSTPAKTPSSDRAAPHAGRADGAGSGSAAEATATSPGGVASSDAAAAAPRRADLSPGRV